MGKQNVKKLKEIEEIKANPIMKIGLKTMIMFNKHLTQIEPLRLPEGIDIKILTPREIVNYHLKDSKLVQAPNKTEQQPNILVANNEASYDSFDNSVDSLVDMPETTETEQPKPVKNYHNNVVVIEQKQYWQKKSNFAPVLNLAAIN